MNYETIILELLSRIQCLEERVSKLEGIKADDPPKVSTGDIRQYIRQKISQAIQAGEESITLKANDIHRELKLKSRFPMVCNAMRQCMMQGDLVIFEPASGYSSALEIRYRCKSRDFE